MKVVVHVSYVFIMLSTPIALIYGDVNVNEENSQTAMTKKTHFDRRLREARVRIEGQRMCTFVLNSLRPAALGLDSDLRDEMAPDLLNQIDNIESRMNRDKSSPVILATGSSAVFARLASGKHYQDTLDDAQCAFIESIYEAKKTISPSTLHDILSKKLGAVQSLLEDPTAELEYGYGGTVNTIPFASAEERSFVFGIYGSELQQPENASDSIRSIAGSYVVSSNIKEIIRALDRSDVKDDNVMVEVELKSALSIVTSLRSLVEEISHTSKVEVVLILDKTANFLEKKKDD